MLVYILTILAFVTFAILSICFQKNKIVVLLTLLGSVVLIILLGSLKKTTIGIDTVAYLNKFESAKNIDLSTYLKEFGKEYLFYTFMWVSARINLSFNLFNGLILACSGFVSALFLYKRSKYPTFFFALFALFTFVNMSLSAIRQTMALAFVLLAILVFTSKKIKIFVKIPLMLVLFAIAFLNHVSSIIVVIMVPIYFFLKKKSYSKAVILLLPSCVVLLTFIYTLFFNLGFEVNYNFLPFGENFSYLGILVFALYCLFLFVPDNKFFKTNYDQTKAMYVVTFLLFICTNFFSTIISRLQFYLAAGAFIFLEDIEFTNKKLDFAFKAVILGGFVIYFIFACLWKNPLSIYPYQFFWE